MNKFFLFLCLLFAMQAAAQSYQKGQILIQIDQNQPAREVFEQIRTQLPSQTKFSPIRSVVPTMGIWLLEFDPQAISHERFLYQLRQLKQVRNAQNNHLISPRVVTPNDSDFNRQWQYINNGSNGGVADADIDADSAWMISTGGLTSLGDTIVVCVIDDGIDLTHQDFAGNIWQNRHEIPNNNIDDDGNGFVDDFDGWNAYDNNDDISGGGHGTAVAGIVGARGDNNLGVAGVNWRVKLMLVNGGGNEADALAAYAYPLAMRRLYNQTGGQRGAYVVATNASWGVDMLQAADAPLWCAMYDSLGSEGVLNAAATTNSNTNVDIDGDMPTSCGSQYLIAVTNMRRNDTKEPAAGYGSQSIDLGAFGTSVWTTELGNTYAPFGGTSGASPHVAGTIGLIYSAPCQRLAVRSYTDPAGTALLVKDFILNGVDANNSLQNISSTGGRLNLNNAMLLAMQSGCAVSGCYEPFFAAADQISGNSMRIHWPGVPDAARYNLRYRMQGDSLWVDSTVTDSFLILHNLQACSNYELQLLSDCDTSLSAYTRVFVFKTKDCCRAPQAISINNIDSSSALLSWASDTFVNSYHLRIYDLQNNLLNSYNSSSASFSLASLQPCTEYQISIFSTCPININNDTSSLVDFKTKGCGACEDLSYCSAEATDASYEWISDVRVGSLISQTNTDGGYGDYTGGNAPLLLVSEAIPVSLSLSQSGSGPSWRWKVWIDLDLNGTLDNTSELVLDSDFQNGQTYDDTLRLPATAQSGVARMRISMKWGTALANSCGNYTYGEIEDYCVLIDNDIATVKNAPNAPKMQLFPNPFADVLRIHTQIPTDSEAVIQFFSPLGQLIHSHSLPNSPAGQSLQTIPTAQLPQGCYLVKIWLNGQAHSQQLMIK